MRIMSEKNSDIKKAAMAIVESQHVMTIASAGDESPWAAPVYYIFYKGSFYFFSKPDSRHIRDTVNGKKAAASIHENASGWADIRGIQMSGVVLAAGINRDSGNAFKHYIKRFNFISEIKNAASLINDIGSLESAFKVKFYKLTPETLFYLDNSIRFGFKESVYL